MINMGKKQHKTKNVISGIYKITNKINGKCYIGQSINIGKRFAQHKSQSYRNIHVNKLLYKAIEKYGIENFSFDVIENCEINILDDREKYWIEYFDSYNKGYNSTKGGKGVSGDYHSCPIVITDKNQMMLLLCDECGLECSNEGDIKFDCPYDENSECMEADELESYFDGYKTMIEDFCDGYASFEDWAECNLI